MSELERWETRFSATDYVFGTEPNAFLARQKSLLPKTGRALAVADGEGRNGVWLAQQGLDVLSIDFSPKAQAKARALAAARGVTLETRIVDVIDWTWPVAEYDVIAVIFIQFLTPEQRTRAFAGMRQALKPGGLLVMEGYTPRQIAFGTGGPKEPENMYTRELLGRAFAGFQSLDIKDYECEMHEGSGHGGRSAVIDLVARK